MMYIPHPIQPEDITLQDVYRNHPQAEVLLHLTLRPGAMPPGIFHSITIPAAERLRDLLVERLGPPVDCLECPFLEYRKLLRDD